MYRALRRWRRTNPGERFAQIHGGLGLYVAELLLERTHSPIPAGELKEPFLSKQDAPELAGVMEFVWSWYEQASLYLAFIFTLQVLRAEG